MRITHVPLPREEAVRYLGACWPPQPGALVTRVGAVGIDHGAVAVHLVDDEPGTTWWAVDGLIVPQDAGPIPELPDCPRETVPEQTPPQPPIS